MQQSMKGKAKDEVDNYHQDNRTDDSGQRGAKVDLNRCKRARRKSNDANDNGGLRHRLGLDFESKFHAPSNGNKENERGELK